MNNKKKYKIMKYKFIYSLSLFSLYGSTGAFFLSAWRSSIWEASLALVSAFICYKLSANWIYSAKEWIRGSVISLILLFTLLTFDEKFLAFAIAISFFGASFIQEFLDEMCRSKEG